MRTWRRLQQLGAIPVKHAVYVLPDTPGTREDFEWLKTEIQDAGGEAEVFAADCVNNWSEDALVEEFRRSRQDAYLALGRAVERVLARQGAPRRRSGTRAPAAGRLLDLFRQRLAVIERTDFFGGAGRDRVVTLLAQLDGHVSERLHAAATVAGAGADVHRYQGRLWVTRPRPGVDRMASAWLIRRFLDERARFGFVVDRDAAGRDAIPFDMFGVEFTHRGDQCTFETLCGVFAIDNAAVKRLAEIVHDLDLKDGRFGAPEVPAVATVIEGLQLAYSDDHELLDQGMVLFEALYLAIAQAGRLTGPRTIARTPKSTHPPGRSATTRSTVPTAKGARPSRAARRSSRAR
ncbi:MAG: chromate resistance protein [Acidobacteria bacterium]|nr:chromate resistance protein [Acidobacteriota bacterium]